MQTITAKEKQAELIPSMKEAFGLKNNMQSPSLEKIVISVGTGRRQKSDRKFNAHVVDRLTKITGQQPAIRSAKKSIAAFKLREGDSIGVAVTLRGDKMNAFFDKLVHIALPRTRDFRGIKRSAVDEMGNLTIGIKEHSIFPACAEEELKDIFGLAVTVVTTAGTKEMATKFLQDMGVPFQKEA